MPTQLPRTIGIRRKSGKSNLHKEVLRNLKQIAASEDKTLSYVMAEIVYKFFGLEIKDDIVKVRKVMKRRKKKLTVQDYNLLHFKKVDNLIRFKRRAS